MNTLRQQTEFFFKKHEETIRQIYRDCLEEFPEPVPAPKSNVDIDSVRNRIASWKKGEDVQWYIDLVLNETNPEMVMLLCGASNQNTLTGRSFIQATHGKLGRFFVENAEKSFVTQQSKWKDNVRHSFLRGLEFAFTRKQLDTVNFLDLLEVVSDGKNS